MPRIGAWTAELALDGTPPTGSCTISVAEGAVSFVGTAVPRTGTFAERHAVQIVGGAGGLSTELSHIQHRAVPLRIPLASILSGAGESLSSTADTATLTKNLTGWSRRAGRAGEAIAELAREGDAAWRVLADGTVWIGPETWPELSVLASGIREDPANDTAELSTDLPQLRPGVTFSGRHVSAVTHRFDAARVRTVIHYERGENAFDRLKGALVGLARAALAGIDYHPSYAATVVSQHGNGDLQVRIDDERFSSRPGTGIAGVKRWPGVPGISYAISEGARVLVGFLDGRPKVPIVTGWSSGTPERVTLEAYSIELGEDATRGIARLNDTVAVPLLPATFVGTAQFSPGVFTPITGMVIWPSQTMGNITIASTKSKSE